MFEAKTGELKGLAVEEDPIDEVKEVRGVELAREDAGVEVAEALGVDGVDAKEAETGSETAKTKGGVKAKGCAVVTDGIAAEGFANGGGTAEDCVVGAEGVAGRIEGAGIVARAGADAEAGAGIGV